MAESDIVVMICPTCLVCGEAPKVPVRRADLKRWQSGEYLQVAFPEMPPAQREMLQSGTHPECWDVLMGGAE
jgi:hypothetical protein